jgi:hypothetical protein
MSSTNGFTHKTAQVAWTLSKGALCLIGNNPDEMLHAKEFLYREQLIRKLFAEDLYPRSPTTKRIDLEPAPPGHDSDISHKSTPSLVIPYP